MGGCWPAGEWPAAGCGARRPSKPDLMLILTASPHRIEELTPILAKRTRKLAITPSMRRPVCVKRIGFDFAGQRFFPCRVTTVAMLPSALSRSDWFRSVHVGRSRFRRCCHLFGAMVLVFGLPLKHLPVVGDTSRLHSLTQTGILRCAFQRLSASSAHFKLATIDERSRRGDLAEFVCGEAAQARSTRHEVPEQTARSAA